MARVHNREIRGRLLLRDAKGNPIHVGDLTNVTFTESRDCHSICTRGDLEAQGPSYDQIDVEITLAGPLQSSNPAPVLSNAEIWREIEALELMHRERDITMGEFQSRRRALIAKMQGPINRDLLNSMPPAHIRGARSSLVAFDESSDLKNYQSAKNLMFAALYGGARPDVIKSLLEWRQVRRRPLITSHAGFVGSFDEVTAGGAHRKNYVFDLEDSW